MKAEYVNHMGDDLMVVNAARVSFAKESSWDCAPYGDENPGGDLKEADKKLIKYLSKNGHWTPFAHPQITLRMDAPVPIRTQCYKHKIGFVENEVSRRYTDEDVEFYMPDGWRGKPTNGAKQGSSELLSPELQDAITSEVSWHYVTSLNLFDKMIESGVCVEQARFVLPQGMRVKWYWTGSLASFARFARQRLDSHAQVEIQQLAHQVSDIIQPLFPVSWEALTGEVYD